MVSERVRARDLEVDDEIQFDLADGVWIVTSMFFEGPDVIDFDLLRTDDTDQMNWHTSSDYMVERS